MLVFPVWTRKLCYRKIKTGVPFFLDHPVYRLFYHNFAHAYVHYFVRIWFWTNLSWSDSEHCTLSNSIFTSGVTFFFFHWLTGQRPTVVLNVQCPRECPRDDFRTFIQLIQQVSRLETRDTNAVYQTVYSLPPSPSYFSRDVTGQRPTVVLNVQCPRECPRNDYRTFIQLIQQLLRLETRHTNALYQTVYSLPTWLSSYFTDSLDSDRQSFWMSNVHANVHSTISPHLSN